MAGVRLASLALSLLLALGLAAFGLAVSWSQLRGPAASDTIVVLQRGMGLSAIASSLEQAGVIRNAPLFSLWLRFSGRADALRAGEYRFPPGASGAEVADILLKGLTYKRRLTIPEGVSTERALALIAEAPALQGAVPTGIGEGALLPETYQYEWGDARGTLVTRMQRAQADLLNALWPQRAPGLPLQSPEQALVLASIVERETAVADERPRVAGVFLNRLKLGMRLQSDPTVEYGLRLRGRPEGQPLTRDDLEIDTPYNTYRIRGLPPAPIANPGRAAIAAVLQPATTNELYFVADGTGGHAFAVTLEEHNRNVARYRALRAE